MPGSVDPCSRNPTVLITRLEAAAETPGTITFVTGDGDGYHADAVPWRVLHEEARAVAAALSARGIGPGAHVALLGPTSRPLVTTIQAIWLVGATVVMLPVPMRVSSVEEIVCQTRARIAAADTDLVVVDDDFMSLFEPAPGDPPIVGLGTLAGEARRRGARRYVRPSDDPDALAILQFTSGSTAEPKGVMIPHRCVTANIDAIVEGARLDTNADIGVSWLPLYHDMGLIGLLGVPMTTGISLVLAGPQDFLTRPARWVQWMSDFRATITGGPNFAYALSARALRRGQGLDLSRWRLALNGAEPIDPEVVDAFTHAGATHGLSLTAPFCVFGMAEATLAVTFPRPGAGLEVDVVDRRVLESDRFAATTSSDAPEARRLAVLGSPLTGMHVRVSEPESGDRKRDREVGEVEIRGRSVTPGYYHRPDATAAAFRGPWLRTGDLGYLVDGRLVVCGRIKDVIIIAGRNVFPEDIERAAAHVDGVRAGNVIAFGTSGHRGTEGIVVVCETRAEQTGPLRDAVLGRVRDAVGVRPRDVVLVRPGALPKTSSGKLQRSLCRERYLEDMFNPV